MLTECTSLSVSDSLISLVTLCIVYFHLTVQKVEMKVTYEITQLMNNSAGTLFLTALLWSPLLHIVLPSQVKSAKSGTGAQEVCE